MREIILNWQRTAAQSISIPSITEEARQQFRDCALVLDGISYYLGPSSDDLRGKEIYVCQDQRGEPQGIMVLANSPWNRLHIEWLATRPENLRASINAGRVEGVGAILLHNAEQLAAWRGLERINVQFFPNAKKFFQRCGFQEVPEDGINVMEKQVG